MSEEDHSGHGHVLGAFDPIEGMIETMQHFIELVITFEKDPDSMPAKEFLRAAHTAHETMEAIQFVAFSTLMRSAGSHIPEDIRREHYREINEEKENRTPEQYMAQLMQLLSRLTRHIDLSDLTDVLPDYIPDSFLDGVEAGSGVDAMRAALAKALGKSSTPAKPDLSKLAADEPAHPCELCGKNELSKLAENGIHDLWKCSCGFTHTSEDCCDRRS